MISLAIEKGSFIYVYDERNRQVCTLSGTLVGYTSTTVSVKRGGFIYTYDQNGRQISVH